MIDTCSIAISSILNILTYNGSTLDILLNYIAVILTVTTEIVVLETRYNWLKYFWIVNTLTLFVFQVSFFFSGKSPKFSL